MKKVGIMLFIVLTFWNVLQEKVNIETTIIGLFIFLFVYKLNKEIFMTK